jgi:hypothetical protein
MLTKVSPPTFAGARRANLIHACRLSEDTLVTLKALTSGRELVRAAGRSMGPIFLGERRPGQPHRGIYFNVLNSETNANFKVTATLVYATENVYFFAENGVRVDTEAVKSLVDDFQNKTYPTDREFFGSEWTPGVDGDPRVYILYTRPGLVRLHGHGRLLFVVGRILLAGAPVLERERNLLHQRRLHRTGRCLAAGLPGARIPAHDSLAPRHQRRNVDEFGRHAAELLNGYQPAAAEASASHLQLNAW